MGATKKKESVTGAVQMVGAVGKVGLEMDVMEMLEEVMVINANLIQVCTPNPCMVLLLVLIKNCGYSNRISNTYLVLHFLKPQVSEILC